MTPDQLAAYIRTDILEPALAGYRQDLECHPGALDIPAKDRAGMGEFYQSLSDEQRFAFMTSVRHVMIDTLSNVLGVFDGATELKDHRDFFHLTYGEDPRDLNGELQDLFLLSITD